MIMPGAVNLIGQLPIRVGAPPYPIRTQDPIGLCIHYSGAPNAATPLQIARYQTGPKDGDQFPEVAYTFFVDEVGYIFQLHSLETRTWHAGGTNNDRYIGMLVDVPTSLEMPFPHYLQLISVLRVLDWLQYKVYQIPAFVLIGHKEVAPTSCPGIWWTRGRILLGYLRMMRITTKFALDRLWEMSQIADANLGSPGFGNSMKEKIITIKKVVL